MLTVVLGLAVAGVVTPTAARFDCGGKIVVARFTNARAVLTIGRTSYRLGQVEAADGARYQGGAARNRVDFWTRGEGATLVVGRRRYAQCVLADLPTRGGRPDVRT